MYDTKLQDYNQLHHNIYGKDVIKEKIKLAVATGTRVWIYNKVPISLINESNVFGNDLISSQQKLG